MSRTDIEDRVLKTFKNSHKYLGLKQLSVENRIIFFWTLSPPFIFEPWTSWSIFHLKENETYLVRRIYWVQDYIFEKVYSPHTFGCDTSISIDLANRIVNSFPKSNKIDSYTGQIIMDGVHRRAIIFNDKIDHKWCKGEENQLYDNWLEDSAKLLNEFMPIMLSKYDIKNIN